MSVHPLNTITDRIAIIIEKLRNKWSLNTIKPNEKNANNPVPTQEKARTIKNLSEDIFSEAMMVWDTVKKA